jgi:hypothetical protein
MGTVFIVRQADADVVAASSHAICGIGQIRSRRAMTTESMLDHGTFTPCAWRVLKRVQDACKEECAMERRAEAGQVMARSRASTTDRQAVTSPLSLPYVFFFFFFESIQGYIPVPKRSLHDRRCGVWMCAVMRWEMRSEAEGRADRQQ